MKLALRLLTAVSLLGTVRGQVLYGICGPYGTPGVLGTFSTTTGTWTPIGSTSKTNIGDLEFSPDGTLYAVRVLNQVASQILTIDPATATATSVGLINHLVADMAFAPTGELHAVGFDFNTLTSQLLKIDVSTGAIVSSIPISNYHLGGLAMRSDGMLIVRDLWDFRVIDPANGQTIATFPYAPSSAWGGLTAHGNRLYFALPSYWSAHETTLSSIDPYTGVVTPIGPFGPIPTELEVWGLAGRGCYDAMSYCTAGTSSAGCVASLTSSGFPSVAATSGFVVSAQQVQGHRTGLFFYGVSGMLAQPLGSSNWLCVRSPTQRTSLQQSGGIAQQCNGSLSLDWLAWTSAHPGSLGTPLHVGTQVCVQAWYRGPGLPTLTDALQFLTCP